MKEINTIEQREIYDMIKSNPNILQRDILKKVENKVVDGKKVYNNVNSARSTVSRLTSTLESRGYIKRKLIVGVSAGVPMNSWIAIK